MTHKKELLMIDLFCWAWWFTLWFEKKWFKNVFAIDIENDYCETYKTNFPKNKLIKWDIKELSNETIKKIVKNKQIDVIIWWPPCQWFSMAWNIWRKFIDDPRNKLFKEFIRVVGVVQPKYIVMENVARLYTHNKWETKKEIIKEFNKHWYNIECKKLCSADYWVPQIRNRIIFIWNRLWEKNIFPEINIQNQVSVKEAISHLPKLKSWETSNIINHEAMNHTSQMLEKMSYIKDWWDRNHIPEKLRPKSWDVRKYIKYNSLKPSICITWDMRKVFHYDQNRALTVRELACLQSFPENFTFKWTSISKQQQVWNAVPPLMAESLAENILNMIKNEKK